MDKKGFPLPEGKGEQDWAVDAGDLRPLAASLGMTQSDRLWDDILAGRREAQPAQIGEESITIFSVISNPEGESHLHFHGDRMAEAVVRQIQAGSKQIDMIIPPETALMIGNMLNPGQFYDLVPYWGYLMSLLEEELRRQGIQTNIELRDQLKEGEDHYPQMSVTIKVIEQADDTGGLPISRVPVETTSSIQLSLAGAPYAEYREEIEGIKFFLNWCRRLEGEQDHGGFDAIVREFTDWSDIINEQGNLSSPLGLFIAGAVIRSSWAGPIGIDVAINIAVQARVFVNLLREAHQRYLDSEDYAQRIMARVSQEGALFDRMIDAISGEIMLRLEEAGLDGTILRRKLETFRAQNSLREIKSLTMEEQIRQRIRMHVLINAYQGTLTTLERYVETRR